MEKPGRAVLLDEVVLRAELNGLLGPLPLRGIRKNNDWNRGELPYDRPHAVQSLTVRQRQAQQDDVELGPRQVGHRAVQCRATPNLDRLLRDPISQ